MFRSIYACLVIGLLLTGCASITKQVNNFSTISAAPESRGTAVPIEAPLPDATNAVIYAIENSNYEVRAAEAASKDKNRLLIQQGVTLTSWGEVGRVILTSLDDSSTNAVFFVRGRQDAVEWEDRQGWELDGWKSDIEFFLAERATTGNQSDVYRISKVEAVETSSDDSEGGRAVVGFLSGGIFGAALANEGVEDDVHIRYAYRYSLLNKAGETKEILTFSLHTVGDCAEVFQPDDTDSDSVQLLNRVNESACREQGL